MLLVLNEQNSEKAFSISFNGKQASCTITANTVATLVW
ncbi:hypothetical protein LWM68_18690 [Niabella sp. W65]|nr:hypothetical protein [Niabella sp. W65]MCH7364602.1 hypothetical protein [Niabella sp. W65]ULT40457.1 hypothetical protein KRR40_37585 [Niabella sp. I65]